LTPGGPSTRDITYARWSDLEPGDTREITGDTPSEYSDEYDPLPPGVSFTHSSPPAIPPQRQKKRMSKPVLFHGKPSEVDNVLTHCLATFAADGTTDPGRRAGYLASLFRGIALTWLTNQIKDNPNVLADFSAFVERVKSKYSLNDYAKNGQLARQLAGLRQVRSVQDYATAFEPLAEQTGLTPHIAIAQFKRGLKPHIQRALVTADDYSDIETVISEAVRIDSEFYNIRQYGGSRSRGQGANRDGKGRWKSRSFKREEK